MHRERERCIYIYIQAYMYTYIYLKRVGYAVEATLERLAALHDVFDVEETGEVVCIFSLLVSVYLGY
jgi:hypothetical protein